MIDVSFKEKMYLISVDKQNHPDHGYESQIQADSNSNNTETKQIFTRARLVKDLTNKTVMYYDGKIVRHMNYRRFKNMIDGVVYKYVFDENIDNFEIMKSKDCFILQ